MIIRLDAVSEELFYVPHSSTGTPENTYGLLRQSFSKGCRPISHTTEELNAVAAEQIERTAEKIAWLRTPARGMRIIYKLRDNSVA